MLQRTEVAVVVERDDVGLLEAEAVQLRERMKRNFGASSARLKEVEQLV